MNGWYQVITGV